MERICVYNINHISRNRRTDVGFSNKTAVTTTDTAAVAVTYQQYNRYSYSTVTDFARFLGQSTLHPLRTAM